MNSRSGRTAVSIPEKLHATHNRHNDTAKRRKAAERESNNHAAGKEALSHCQPHFAAQLATALTGIDPKQEKSAKQPERRTATHVRPHARY